VILARLLSARWLLAGMAGASVLAVAAALHSQHVWGMMPCAWCVLQRLIFVAVALAALLGLLLPGATGRRIGAALALGLAGSGLAAALWLHFVASASASCNMTLADRVMGFTGLDSLLPEVFAAYASCADAKVILAGMPYEFWSGALFTVLMLAALQVLRRPA
jgi:protein dithiol:quinone oxidoreductase